MEEKGVDVEVRGGAEGVMVAAAGAVTAAAASAAAAAASAAAAAAAAASAGGEAHRPLKSHASNRSTLTEGGGFHCDSVPATNNMSTMTST